MLRLALRGRDCALALIVGLGVLGACALGVLREYQAARARAAWDGATLEQALRGAGDDAGLHNRLGRWEQFSLVESDLDRALLHYRRATELNPYESHYWLDLADALLLKGDPAAAEPVVRRALEVDPRTPLTLWRGGNFWLRSGHPARAFPIFRQVLENDPHFTNLALQVSHRTLRDPETLVRDLLPPRPEFYLAYLRQLVREGEAESPAAAWVWKQLVGLGQPFEAKDVLFYLDFLIRTRQLPQAETVWSDLKGREFLPADEAPTAAELLYNPSLRHPILNGGFDWRAELLPSASVSLGPGRPGRPEPAVIIRFSGEQNLHYRSFYQYVLVESNRRYRFQAWLSTEGITTESGPRLEIVDATAAEGGGARSPGVVGTTDWIREEVEFLAGPRTRLLRVGVVRLPSRRLNSQIRGTLRVAEFSLRAVEPGAVE